MWRAIFHLTVVVINSSFLLYDQMFLKLEVPVKTMEDLPFKSRSMFLTMWGLTKMSKVIMPFFHLVIVIINSFVIYYDQLYVHIPIPLESMKLLPFNARSMFLTFWCLVLQTVYHFVALLNDIWGTDEKAPKHPPFIRRIKDTLFSLAFTTAIYVSAAFWSIYAIDKELILPERIAKIYPPLFNHIMHTTVSIFIIIELLTSCRNYPSRIVGLSIMHLFYIAYTVWFFVVHAKTGGWPYPIFDYLNWPSRIIFIAASLIIGTGIYILGEKLNRIVCGPQKTLENGSPQLSDKSKSS